MFLKPGLTLWLIRRTQRGGDRKLFKKSFMVFEAQIRKQYTGTRGNILEETVQNFKTEFIF